MPKGRAEIRKVSPSRPRARRRFSRAGWGWALAGGIAGGLAFEPFGLRALIPIAPAALFLAARAAPTPAGAAARVFSGGFLFYMIAISWLITVSRFYPITAPGIPFVAGYLAFFPAAAAWIVRRFCSRLGLILQFATFSALWLIGEWIRTLGRHSFPWAMLGHAWAPWPPVIQIAEWFGESGVSLEILLVAAALLAVARCRMKLDERPIARPAAIRAASLAVAAAVLPLGLSAWRYGDWSARIDSTPAERTLLVAAVQPNVDQFEKMDSYGNPDAAIRERLENEHFERIGALIRDDSLAGVDLIVLPESAFASMVFSIDSERQARVEVLARSARAAVLFGATKVRFNAEALRRGETEFDELYNSAWFIPAGGRIDPDARQDKMRLVPFGEFLPFGGVLPFIRTAVGMEDFDAGREVRLFDVKGAKFGAMVCFESAYAAQSRLIARQGADFLAVITNDGWYGRSAGPTQHHALSRLRAVETRRPVVRSANTGISSIVDPAGRLTATLELEKSGAAVGAIAPQSAATLFMKWGSLWLMSACAALLLVLLVQGRIAEKAATAPAK